MFNKKYPSLPCSCIICKQVKSSKGINQHYLTSHTKEGNDKIRNASIIGLTKARSNLKDKKLNIKLQETNKYYKNPNSCTNCKIVLPYNQRTNKFCSHTCSATFSNKNRIISQEQKDKTSITLKSKLKPKKIKIESFKCRKCKSIHHSREDKFNCCSSTRKIISLIQKQVKLETKNTQFQYSKIKLCKCKHCNINFYYKSQLQYCSKCRIYYSNKRTLYRFTFNIFDYPDLFNLDLLQQIGFYSPGGKSGKWNPDGLSRDHKISVSSAISNSYDPYYISHPCNCELMIHRENAIKKTKSSITYEHLKKIVNEYDLLNN